MNSHLEQSFSDMERLLEFFDRDDERSSNIKENILLINTLLSGNKDYIQILNMLIELMSIHNGNTVEIIHVLQSALTQSMKDLSNFSQGLEEHQIMDNAVSSLIGRQLDNFENSLDKASDVDDVKGLINDHRKKVMFVVNKCADERKKKIKEQTAKIEEIQTSLENKQKEITLLEKQKEALRKEAFTDSLTNINNRKAFDDVINLSKNVESQSYIAIIDIDRFKQINDNYGHSIGDAVLKSFGKLLSRYNKKFNYFSAYRYGGEEFVVVLENINEQNAFKMLTMIRNEVEKEILEINQEKIKYTISAGLAEKKQHTSMTDALKLADQRLYKAKESGRNRVIKV